MRGARRTVRRPSRERALLTATATVSAVAAALLYAASNPGVVGLIDSGELMAVVMSGGVAHPTGYPLFTLLGYALAPWAGESPPALLAWLSHGPAALTVGLLCGVVARTMLRAGHGALHAALSAALVAAALGSSRSFWLAAGEIEVYTLTALLSAVLLALAWEGLGTSANRTRRRLFLLWCLIFGLAAGNHLSVLATAPAGLWLLSALPRRTRFTDTARGTAWALLGATVVLQLPLRAGAAPLLNWGDPSTSAAFLRHLRGAQYQVWMFTRGPAELATAAIHNLRVKCLIINNNYLGMVRQWQELFFENRLSGVDLEGNPDFVKLAQAYGIKAFRIKRPGDVDRILAQADAYDEGPCVVVAEVVKEDNVFPFIPAGATLGDMIIEKPTKKLAKPTGST